MKRVWMCLLIFFPFCIYGESFKTSTWDFTANIKRYRFLDKHPHRSDALLGHAHTIGIAHSYFGHRLRFGGGLGLVLGPYEKVENDAINVDLSGNNFEVHAGYLFFGGRGKKGSWGCRTSSAYTDLVGRSRRGRAVDDAELNLLNYSTRIRVYSSSFEVNLAFLDTPRPAGNLPDDLVTRIEGYIYSFGLEYPWRIDYKTGFTMQKEDEINDQITREGRMQGIAIYGGLTVVLGV